VSFKGFMDNVTVALNGETDLVATRSKANQTEENQRAALRSENYAKSEFQPVKSMV